jgi:5-(aminomethyl)-3-furanmethanol phosphate kinase
VESSLRRSADVVVKVGGGVLADVAGFDAVLATLGEVARSCRLVIVPGGGPFADAVRAVDRQLGLSATTAHWMAIAAMDQYAEVIAERLDRTSRLDDPQDIGPAIAEGRVPVLRPSRWLREADPLPHSWDVTSDSIAAWIAGQVGARHLILVKPAGARTERAVDAYFSRALPTGVELVIVPADRIGELRSAVVLRRSG